ncbi:Glucoamylase (glucan-1,4-alpha-glucosidase), GH15 family [Catalinimonas alkaloidigena]|uniref:Glucoamylase (Glucan-1,4-alpha-glucosidase), GH15 family n=1 Tax=Catalinimonas alkaloidigena TaxID=1075417 RepID=A0A1G9EX62_9BACT|nr:glycoside hydrolase family 15 protein [Catalinimonas alkaloidigena]SDK80575.1 Glucoamylase (glucan-1,4-alpha-glucosidase), GH15 family [Catalinimonas alkaloidigena]
MKNKHTYNLGVIGNCAFLAHIDDHANVAWMCWPSFDSSFVFGALLDKQKGGEFRVRPNSDQYQTRQYYLQNTNVLCTEFDTASGRFRVTDFAPRFHQNERYYKPLMMIRKIEPLDGQPQISVSCRPVGEYGELVPQVNMGSNHLQFTNLEKDVRLTTNIPLNYVKDQRDFLLTEPKYLVLTWGIPMEAPLVTTSEDFLRKTIHHWREWVRRCQIKPYWQEEMIRSALILKIHQYEDTGAIIASATTSLPEAPGSGRTWDYRYCWMRDSYYTLKALNDIGHFEELERYAGYIQNIAFSDTGRYSPVYSILGDGNFPERELALSGYEGNRPVRIGNQAKEHIQNDVYGQILVSLLPLYVDQRLVGPERNTMPNLIMRLLRFIERTMDEPDAGLWEFRNFSQRHCYTFLFHWAGSSAALKIARLLKHEEMESLASRLVRMSAQQIEKCYRPEMGAYAQAIETNNMDASLLQMIPMGYLDNHSERAIRHVETLEKALKTPEGLFYRYLHQDDFGKPETTFLVCAFWYVDALACIGRIDDAVRYFESLLKFTNHLGLLSEDVEATSGSQWGNFPQTYSHVGLMNAVNRIAARIDKPLFL